MFKPVNYPKPFQDLVEQLRRLPSIGPRSAERIALWLVTSPDARPGPLQEAIGAAAERLTRCERCGFFSTGNLCAICESPDRASREICVVERATDVLAMERTGAFHGLYHVLGGRLAPLENVGPEDLRIRELIARIGAEQPSEIILALSADVEGEATANYLSDELAQTGVRITRIAQGLPAGGGLDHADQLTLTRALSGRRKAGR